MARIIFSILFLVALAVLIVMNVGTATSVNVFGWKVEELSVTVVALVSFVAGVIYSFVFYLISYLERGRKDRLARRKQKLKNQELELKTREQEVGDLAQESKRQLETAKNVADPVPLQPRAGVLANLFGKRRTQETETIIEPSAPLESTRRRKKR